MRKLRRFFKNRKINNISMKIKSKANKKKKMRNQMRKN